MNDNKSTACQFWDNIRTGVAEDSASFKNALFNILGVRTGPAELASSSAPASHGQPRTIDDLKQTGANLSRDAQEKLQRSLADTKQTVSNISRDAGERTQSIFNWGASRAERTKAIAIGEYDKANKRYQELLEKFNESKKGFFSKGDEQLGKMLDEANKELELCKKKLQSASTQFDEVANRNITDLSNQLAAEDERLREKGFLDWFKTQTLGALDSNTSGADTVGLNSEVDAAAKAAKALEGWGETAAQLSKEELEAEKEKATRFWNK